MGPSRVGERIATYVFVSLLSSILLTSSSCDAFVHHLRPSPRVTLGVDFDASRVPFFCSLHVNFPDDSGTFVCGCALISPTIGATAAHCIVKDGEGFADARVRLYGSAFTVDVLRLGPGAVAVHPEYDVGGHLANDVAVFRISDPLDVDAPTLNRERRAWDALTSWDRLTVVGVGKTSSEGPLSLGTPLRAHLSRRDCENPENYFGEALVGWSLENHLEDLCAGPYEACAPEGSSWTCADSCGGDSGGPLFAETEDGNVTLYGLVSRGSSECGARGVDGGRPGIYTPTDAHWSFLTTAGETLDPRPPYLTTPTYADDRSTGTATTTRRRERRRALALALATVTRLLLPR